MHWKVEKLLNGETFISKEGGNSMVPIIKSKQPFRLKPITWEKVKVGDIVYCKVKGKLFTHLVKAIDKKKGCLIGNNKGGTNGWTRSVYGIVTEILPMGNK